MIGTTAAILGASAIGAGASIYGANKAAKQQSKSQNAALDLQREQYNNANALLKPYVDSGTSSLDVYKTALGLNGAGKQAEYYKNFQYDPGFTTALDKSLSDTMNRYSIYGDTGGGLAKDLLKTGQEAIGGAYNTRLAQIGGLADSGRTAAGALAGAGQNMANASGNIISSTSYPYQAQGIVNAGNALIGGIGNWQNQQMYQQGQAAGTGGWSTSYVPSNAIRW